MSRGAAPVAPPRLTVIIPAHNEVSTIGRCLRAASRPGARPVTDVVAAVLVVVNGSSDATAAAARETGRELAVEITVTELAHASKAAAINAGLAAAGAGPVVVLDADIEVAAGTLAELAEALARPGVLVASPQLQLDLTGCAPLVRAYYDCWQRLPWATEALVGSGCYALSAAGRERLGALPALIADDLVVSRAFSGAERAAPVGAMIVRPPRTLASLLAVRTRVQAGNRQWEQRAGSAAGTGTRGRLLQLARDPRRWPGLGAYVGVTALARRRARGALAAGVTPWSQDQTARGSR